MYWAGDRFECLMGSVDKMNWIEDVLEQAAQGVTYFVVIPMILFFLVGVMTAWMF